MDRVEWGPPTAGIAAIAVAGIIMAIGAMSVAADAAGRILTAIAAVGLAIFAAGSWRARPRLAITGEGLVYRGWLSTTTLRRPDIELIRITEFRRWGERSGCWRSTTADRLIVLSRWDLGGDPLEVLDALTEAGYAG